MAEILLVVRVVTAPVPQPWSSGYPASEAAFESLRKPRRTRGIAPIEAPQSTLQIAEYYGAVVGGKAPAFASFGGIFLNS